MHLRPCTGCERHVRATHVRCPFCGASLGAASEPIHHPGRLGRAALIAFAASVAACHEDPKPNPPVPQPAPTASAEPSVTATASVAPIASVVPSATATASATAAASAAPADAGAKDAGKTKTAATVTATATTNWHNLAKPYGAPPPRDRKRV